MVHGCMVYTERAETAAVSLGSCGYVSAVCHNSGEYSQKRYRKLVSCVGSHSSALGWNGCRNKSEHGKIIDPGEEMLNRAEKSAI